MKLRIYIILLFLSFLGCALPSKAQVITRRLSYTQLFEEIQNTKDSVYRLENAEIYHDENTDNLRFGFGSLDEKIPKEFKTRYYYYGSVSRSYYESINYYQNNEKLNSYLEKNLPMLLVDKHVFLTNVNFDYLPTIEGPAGVFFRRIKFNKGFYLNNKLSKSYKQFFFEKCDFGDYMPSFIENTYPDYKISSYGVYFRLCNFNGTSSHMEVLMFKSPSILVPVTDVNASETWDFYDCVFKSGIMIHVKSNNNSLTFHNCIFKQNLIIRGVKNSSSITLKKSTFLSQNNKLSGIDIQETENIEIDSCVFEKTSMGLYGTSCKNFYITNSSFKGGFHLVNTKIADELLLEDNYFTDFLLSSGSAKSQSGKTLINWNNSFLTYDQFKNNISTYINDSTAYRGITNKELSNNIEYKHLKEHYNTFYKMYSDKKDQESANACYVALKDLETRKLGYDYQYRDKSFKKYLTWKLNVFLRYFCDYGTDPVKALEKSVYWILIFTLLYIIFPSEKDYLHKSLLMPKLQKWANYLKHEGGFAEIEDKKRQEKIEALERFKTELKNTEGKIPMVLSIFSKPLYSSAMLYYKLQKWLIHKIDFTQGNWVELSKKRKLMVSVGMFSYLLVFVFWGITMRILNALALSINCFVTLGYGEISAKGIARYLAVLEGLFGWFLLSIFSVSLIGQILG